MKHRLLFILSLSLLGTAAPVRAQVEGEMTINYNVYRPSKDGPLTITFTPAHTGKANLSVYNTGGQFMFSVDMGDVTARTAKWVAFGVPGVTNSNVFDTLANGVYLFHIRYNFGVFNRLLLVAK